MWMTVLFACVISIACYAVINYLIKNSRSLLAGDQSVAQKNATNLLAIFAALITGVITSFVMNFNFSRGYDISGSVEQWGQMGDFFGGMLNPILAFASFIALLYTIRIQSEELRLTREEFAKSSKAQYEISETAKKELELAKVSYASQLELQFSQPVFDICHQKIKDCEGMLRNKAIVKQMSYDGNSRWLDFIVSHAMKSSPAYYQLQLTSPGSNGNKFNNLLIAESLRILHDVKYEFEDAWNAIETIASVMKTDASKEIKNRMTALVIRRLARIAYLLHITGVREFNNEIHGEQISQNDFLVDQFRFHLKRIYDIA